MSDTKQDLDEINQKDIDAMSFEIEPPTDVYYGVGDIDDMKDSYDSEKNVNND